MKYFMIVTMSQDTINTDYVKAKNLLEAVKILDERYVDENRVTLNMVEIDKKVFDYKIVNEIK